MTAALDRREVVRALTGKLMMTADTSRHHHQYFELRVDGRIVARTRVSHSRHSDVIGPDLVTQMAKQCHVPTGFFMELVQCTKSHDDYLARLRSSGLL